MTGFLSWKGRGRITPLLLIACLVSCEAPQWNSVREARADQLSERKDVRLAALRRELAAKERAIVAAEARLRELELEVGDRRVALAQGLSELDSVLLQLQAAEEDLAAASERRGVVEKSLADLQALEAERADRTARKTALEQEIADLQKGLQADLAALTARRDELLAQRKAAQGRLGEVEADLSALRAAIEAIDPPPSKEAAEPAAEGGDPPANRAEPGTGDPGTGNQGGEL